MRDKIAYAPIVGSVLLYVVNMDVTLFQAGLYNLNIIFYVLQLLALVYLYKQPTIAVYNKRTVNVLIGITLFLFVFHGFTSLTYVYKAFMFLICLQIQRTCRIEDIQYWFCRLTLIFAVSSLIFYFMLNFAGTIGPEIVFRPGSMGDGREYATNLIYTYLTEWPIRNCGIFHEPGAYQIYLNIALIFYYNIKKNVVVDLFVFVIIISIFTTLSSPGVIAGCAIIALRFVTTKKTSIYANILFAIMGIAVYVAVSEMFDMIFYKLMLGKSESGSAYARYYSVFIPMRIMLDYPLFGCGAWEFNSVITHYKAEGDNLTPGLITNTITTNFATSGFFYGLFYLCGFYKGVKRITRFITANVLYIIICFALVSCENITYSYIFSFLMIYGLVSFKPINYVKSNGKDSSIDDMPRQV